MEYEYPDVRMKLSQVVIELINKSSFLGVIVSSLPLEESMLIPFPMGVNSKHIIYNPEMLLALKLDNSDLKFILAHEAMHYLQKGPIRIEQYQQEYSAQIYQGAAANRVSLLYNVANDLAINSILVNDGWQEPDKQGCMACVPGRRSYKDFPPLKDTEWYFNILMELERQHQEEEQKKQDQKDKEDDDEQTGDQDQSDEEGDSGSGDDDEEREDNDGSESDSEEDETSGDGDDEDEPEDTDDDRRGGSSGKGGKGRGKNGRKGNGDKGESDEDEGSSDGGENDDSETGDDDGGDGTGSLSPEVAEEIEAGGRTGFNEDGQEVTQLNVADLIKVLFQYPADILADKEGEQMAESDVNQRIAMSVSMGNEPGSHVQSCMERMLAKEVRPSEINWKRALQMYLTARDHSTTTYKRPNRRRNDPHIIFPSRNNQTLGETALVFDTSGSMLYYMQPIVMELYTLITSFTATSFWLIMCDSAVRAMVQFRKGVKVPNFKEWNIKGLGGTDMLPGFIEAEHKRVSTIVCATDLEYGGQFPPKPRCPVIWIVPNSPACRGRKVPYGNVVYFTP